MQSAISAYQMQEEIVEHGGDPIDHDAVREDRPDVPRHHLESRYRLVAHDVVKLGQHAEVAVPGFSLALLLVRQSLPFTIFLLLLLLLDLTHVLKRR